MQRPVAATAGEKRGCAGLRVACPLHRCVEVHPEIRVVLGGLQLVFSAHALAVLLGVNAGAVLACRRARDPAPGLLAVVAATVAGLAGARLLNVALHGGPGGLSSMGGIAAGLVATGVVARLVREPALVLLDAIAPAAVLALAIGRLGCFLAGCCYGTPTALPWGVTFPEPGPPPRHPLQLYSAAGDLALLRLLPGRSMAAGTAFRRLACGLGLLRLGLESLRDAATADVIAGGPLTLAQAGSLVLLAGALGLRPRGGSTMPPAPEDSAAWPTRKR